MLGGHDGGSSQKKQIEEMYEKLFPKIARDFVFTEDLQTVLVQLQEIISMFSTSIGLPASLSVSTDPVRALAKGLIYKEVIEGGKDGSKIFKDLLCIDDEDDEEESEEESEEEEEEEEEE